MVVSIISVYGEPIKYQILPRHERYRDEQDVMLPWSSQRSSEKKGLQISNTLEFDFGEQWSQVGGKGQITPSCISDQVLQSQHGRLPGSRFHGGGS